MISEWFIGLIQTVANWFIGLMPEWDAPPEFVNFDATLNGFTASFNGLGVWVPWALLVTCVVIAIAAYLIGLTVKAARWVLGLVPTMGGGT